MKSPFFLVLSCLLLFSFTLLINNELGAQNVGIGTAAPAEKLHVAGNIRSNSLASADTNVVVSDINGTLRNLGPGVSGEVLTSRGPGRSPAWGSVVAAQVQVYGANATRTFINSTSFISVTGLSQTIVLAGNAVVQIATSGSMETTSSVWGGSGCIVQVFNNGVAIPNAFQTVDIFDPGGVTNTIAPWSLVSFITLPAGTYTFTVRARKYAFDNFYAGGNFTAPNPNEGTLVITVINQ